ncbi:tetratricopeptide repeat protein [Roseovarius nanhaiticus]|uniref:tetratricopeptide repeat protein n=1 Tax=Roseovarius nanhaiticus TaxID=573024 RepID=UPI0024909178|nr:tetratricopeptide repeat protein [Roseovarius nanhaiticus]
MRLILALIATLTLALPGIFSAPAQAQDRQATLADIRQELSVLYVEVQKLRRELSTTGGAGTLNTSGSVLDRVGAIESELQRLTARTEEMQLRIDRVVTDGTNRIGDLEFRLVELEGGDTSKLGETTTLGGGDMPSTGGSSAIQPADQGQGAGDAAPAPTTSLAVGEQADFDAAQVAMDAGETARAAELFGNFLQTYPGSPLAPRAYLARGKALEQQGSLKDAAKSYLDGFSADKNGPEAAESLFRLGRALGQLGQGDAACQTLGEVETRFAGTIPATDARTEMQSLSCQ